MLKLNGRKPEIGNEIPMADPEKNRDFSIRVTRFVEEKEMEWIFEGEEV